MWIFRFLSLVNYGPVEKILVNSTMTVFDNFDIDFLYDYFEYIEIYFNLINCFYHKHTKNYLNDDILCNETVDVLLI